MTSEKKASALQQTFRRFTPYPSGEGPSHFEQVFAHLSCTAHFARYFKCRAPWQMAPRRLPHEMFFFVRRGVGRARVEGRNYRLQAGSCLHFRRGELHEASHDPARPIDVLVLHYSALVNSAITLSEILCFPNYFEMKDDAFAGSILWEACRLSTLLPPGSPKALDATALAFLFRIVYDHHREFPSLYPGRLSDLARLSEAIRLMRERFHESLFIDEYAKAIGMSEPHFRRVFLRTMGIAPNQFVRQLRLQRAAFLLRNTRETIENISHLVGYNEPAFFARTFKSEMGMAPGAYRTKADLMDR